MASRKPQIIRYKHHTDKYVAVQEKLKGKHRKHCLCHYCQCLKPDNNGVGNCKIAQLLFSICYINDIVTPVWECPNFIGDEKKCKTDV